jgi:tetratricopeptide (TPR) repeat protein
MIRFLAATVFALLLPLGAAYAADCSLKQYEALVAEGKNAAEGHEWGKSVEVYGRILDDCRPLLGANDLAKAYDALSVGQLMQENYSAAIDSAQKCLAGVPRYNACMMTAAKAYESLGDRSMALEQARAAATVDPYDDYSAAVAIYAKDFLKRLEKR